MDVDDLVELGPNAVALGRMIARAVDGSGPGGARITRQEGRRIVTAALEFARELLQRVF